MTIDVGLTAGISTLWQQKALFDYTIQAGNDEIPVHKAIMASVSDYFRVMLNGSSLESTTNRVKLIGQSGKTVSKLIKLIYTGDERIVNHSAMEILGLAVYFQMTFVIQACVNSLVDSLTAKNCLKLLSVFAKYSCEEGVERVKTFLKSNYKSVVKYCKDEETLYEEVQVIIECWGKSEWDLFLFLKHWVNMDYENRKVHVNDLMSQVRFSLIEQGQLAAILEMDIFISSAESWCDLVRTSVTYHEKPIHHKICDTSVQAKARGPAVPVVFRTDDYYNDEAKSFHAFEKGKWVEYERMNVVKSSKFYSIEACIEINNFLVICSQDYRQQNWNVFDPRTMKWSDLAVNKAPTTGFAPFYHGGKLYTVGGQPGLESDVRRSNGSVSSSIEQYSFHTNKWQEVNRMPHPVMYPSVCVYEDSIYVSGGWRGELHAYTSSPDVDCLDINNGTWEKKAPMPKALIHHKMHLMTLNREKVIVIIDNETDIDSRYDCEITYYQPATDQWTHYEPGVSPAAPYDIRWDSNLMLVQGNRVFFINIQQGDVDDDGGWENNIDPDDLPRVQACVQWTFSHTREKISEVNYPSYPCLNCKKFGAVLSI